VSKGAWTEAQKGWVSSRRQLDELGIDVGRVDQSGIPIPLSAELAAISAPVPLWVCGMPFVLFAGDGGANGLLFTGTAGGFTLSAAVMTGFVIPGGYCYLPANAGGLGNAAGWFYFEMSSTTAGTVYNNGFTPSPGALPVVPASKTAFANPAGGRITQTTADITMLSCSLANGAMGKNGLLKAGIKTLGSSAAGLKYTKFYANTTLLYSFASTTSPAVDWEFIVQNSGSIIGQIATKSFLVLSAGSSSINQDISSFDFGADCTLSLSAGMSVNTETLLVVPRYLNLQAKA
jgi:hypothetical protein